MPCRVWGNRLPLTTGTSSLLEALWQVILDQVNILNIFLIDLEIPSLGMSFIGVLHRHQGGLSKKGAPGGKDCTQPNIHQLVSRDISYAVPDCGISCSHQEAISSAENSVSSLFMTCH